MDAERPSDSGRRGSRASLGAVPATSAGRTSWIQRRRSLSDLNSGKPAPKLHKLQRIPRRTSFDDASELKPDWPGQLFTGYDEDGIHTCSHCQKVIIDLRLIEPVTYSWEKKPRSGRKKPAHPTGDLGVTYAEAKRAAEEGCPLFLSLGPWIDPRVNVGDMVKSRDWYSELPGAMLERPIIYTLPEAPWSPRDLKPFVTLRLERNFDDGCHELYRKWALFSLDGNQLLPPSIRGRQDLLTDSASLHQTARDWMNRCNEQHAECFSYRHEFAPLRLLHVRPESKHNTVILVSPEQPVQYTTLSYCWGGDQRFKTTSETIASAQYGLPLEVLPETVQDAVKITRELGLTYLWVDSLCIVQDDEEEMLDQISQMACIFEGAYVTIAASQSSRSSDGFLSTLDPFGLLCKVSITREDGSNGVAGIGKCSAHNLEHAPIVSRAWTLQETLLSPRILSFECGHVHWYCTERKRTSCMVSEYSRHVYGFDPGFKWMQNDDPTRIHRFYDRILELWPQRLQQSLPSRPRKFEETIPWQELVEMYSTRQLTYDADKLVAISAIAERIAGFSDQGRYLAGMWEENLLKQCTWEVYGSSTRLTSAQGRQVPSWSWASVSGKVCWGSITLFETGAKESCRILSAEVTLRSEKTPFGDVVSGKLIMEGRLKRALWHWEEGRKGAWLTELLDDELLTGGKPIKAFYPDVLQGGSGKLVVFCLEVVPLRVAKYDMWDGGRRKRYRGIVLILTYDERSNEYQRVGCFYELESITGVDKEKKKAIEGWWSKGWMKQTITIV